MEKNDYKSATENNYDAQIGTTPNGQLPSNSEKDAETNNATDKEDVIAKS